MTTINIYDQHETAFSHVSAYVVLDQGGERVASIAFKFPRDGAGRLYCYLHVFGVAMVRGFAAGGGYDKQSAAINSAAAKMDTTEIPHTETGTLVTAKAFQDALRDGGCSWSRYLQDGGFTVLQAV